MPSFDSSKIERKAMANPKLWRHHYFSVLLQWEIVFEEKKTVTLWIRTLTQWLSSVSEGLDLGASLTAQVQHMGVGRAFIAKERCGGSWEENLWEY